MGAGRKDSSSVRPNVKEIAEWTRKYFTVHDYFPPVTERFRVPGELEEYLKKRENELLFPRLFTAYENNRKNKPIDLIMKEIRGLFIRYLQKSE